MKKMYFEYAINNNGTLFTTNASVAYSRGCLPVEFIGKKPLYVKLHYLEVIPSED